VEEEGGRESLLKLERDEAISGGNLVSALQRVEAKKENIPS